MNNASNTHTPARPERPASPAINALNLVASDAVIDLSLLNPEQAAEIQSELAKNAIALHKKKAEMQIAAESLDAQLSTALNHAMRAHDAGLSVTITHVQEGAVGKTEVVLGNTERAEKGGRRGFLSRLFGD